MCKKKGDIQYIYICLYTYDGFKYLHAYTYIYIVIIIIYIEIDLDIDILTYLPTHMYKYIYRYIYIYTPLVLFCKTRPNCSHTSCISRFMRSEIKVAVGTEFPARNTNSTICKYKGRGPLQRKRKDTTFYVYHQICIKVKTGWESNT